MFSVNDVVQVVKVIPVYNEERNVEKIGYIGAFFRIQKIISSEPHYRGQIYKLFGISRTFHADELQLVDKPEKTVPEIGDFVNVLNSKNFYKVSEVTTTKVMVTFVDEHGKTKTDEYVQTAPPEVIVAYEKEAAQLKKEAAQRQKEALIEKQAALILLAKDAMEKANLVAAELVQLENN
jgi:hypothetical protein